MKLKVFFIIFEELSLRRIKFFFGRWESDFKINYSKIALMGRFRRKVCFFKLISKNAWICCRYLVSIVYFEHISNIVLMFPLLTWTSNCGMGIEQKIKFANFSPWQLSSKCRIFCCLETKKKFSALERPTIKIKKNAEG